VWRRSAAAAQVHAAASPSCGCVGLPNVSSRYSKDAASSKPLSLASSFKTFLGGRTFSVFSRCITCTLSTRHRCNIGEPLFRKSLHTLPSRVAMPVLWSKDVHPPRRPPIFDESRRTLAPAPSSAARCRNAHDPNRSINDDLPSPEPRSLRVRRWQPPRLRQLPIEFPGKHCPPHTSLAPTALQTSWPS
jgi:hypothetical protein